MYKRGHTQEEPEVHGDNSFSYFKPDSFRLFNKEAEIPMKKRRGR